MPDPSSAPLTLADVRQLITEDDRLAPLRRRELCCSLKRVSTTGRPSGATIEREPWMPRADIRSTWTPCGAGLAAHPEGHRGAVGTAARRRGEGSLKRSTSGRFRSVGCVLAGHALCSELDHRTALVELFQVPAQIVGLSLGQPPPVEFISVVAER